MLWCQEEVMVPMQHLATKYNYWLLSGGLPVMSLAVSYLLCTVREKLPLIILEVTAHR